MAKELPSDKAAPPAAPADDGQKQVADLPDVVVDAKPTDPGLPRGQQLLGNLWYLLGTREWLQKRTVGVGMILDDVPIITRPLVYEMPSGAGDATADNSEASVDGPTAITFEPKDVCEIVDAEDGQTVPPGDGPEVVVLADDLAMEIVIEYRRWKPTIDELRRAMCAAGLMQPQADVTEALIRKDLFNWLGVVCLLTPDEARKLPVAEVVKLLDAGASSGHPNDGDDRAVTQLQQQMEVIGQAIADIGQKVDDLHGRLPTGDDPRSSNTPPPELLAKLRGERGELLRYLWQRCPVSLGELAQERWSDNPDEGTARRAVDRLRTDLAERGYPDLVDVEKGVVQVHRI